MCVYLSGSCSIYWNLSPTSEKYTTLQDSGCGINELSRLNMASVIETLVVVYVCTKSYHLPTRHLLSNSHEPGTVLVGQGTPRKV